MQKFNAKLLVIAFILLVMLNPTQVFSQHENHENDKASPVSAPAHDLHAEEEKEFNAVDMIMEHISDANEWHIATVNNHHYSIPLPVILWDGSFKVFMSSAVAHGHEHEGYTLHEGKLASTTGLEKAGLVDLFTGLEGKYVDLSITKNVAGILISCLVLFFVFRAVSKSYKKHRGVPKGIAGFMEPVILFIRDEVAVPNIGYKDAGRFLPLLLTIFFFIWFNNLLGLIPLFPGGANVTGNIAVTLVLALVTMVVVNINGKSTYWKHIFKPDVPALMYVIMIPVELIGIFTKPFALMMRLFANITAGHIMILSLISLIFIFQNALVGFASVPLALFISILELLVAALQAYIFTVLTALFIGMAVQEHH